MAPQPAPPRIAWLEGLRGVASLQVLLLHVAGAFCLGLVEGEPAAGVRSTPLFLLYDGATAVFVFFLLSGAVLSGAFARSLDSPLGQMAGRALRLGLPALAATLLGFALFHLFQPFQQQAGSLLAPSWVAGNWLSDGGLGALLWQAGPVALLTGFRDTSSLGALPLGWPADTAAFNAPLWTLSIEMQGSALVLALVMLRRRAPRLWAPMLGLAVLLCLRSPLLGFLVGHAVMASGWRWAPGPGRFALGGLALAAGAALAIAPPLTPFVALHAAPLPLLPALAPEAIQGSLAAMLELGGLVLLPAAPRRALEGRFFQTLGRYSFPVYLLHWPLMLGPGAATGLLVTALAGDGAARIAGAVATLLLTLLLARALLPLDAAVVRLARRLRSAPLWYGAQEDRLGQNLGQQHRRAAARGVQQV